MKSRRPGIWFTALCLAVALPAQAQPSVETPSLQLSFGTQGQLVEATACLVHCADEAARRVKLQQPEGLVRFSDPGEGRWSVRESANPRERVLEFSGPDGRSVRWAIPAVGYGIGLVTERVGDLMLQSGDGFQPQPAAGFGNWLEQVRYVVIDAAGARQFGLDDIEAEDTETEWAGYRSRFWAVLVSAEDLSRFAMETAEGNAQPRLVRTGTEGPQQLLLYLGPVEPVELAAVDRLLQELMYAGLWFWLRWICFALFYLLTWLHAAVPVWGVAIMLLSICVSVLMSPLSRAADRLQQQVHATEARLAPELARIKQAHRGEQQAARIVALYKSERVHPLYSLKSLLGVAIVIPVFIGAFDMLAENIHLLNAGFLWVRDLSRPDAFAQLPFELPFFGGQLNLLPFLMTALSILASALHRPPAQHPDLRRRQLRNMVLLAAAFFVLFYTFPAGMVLYWTTNNLISVGKGLWARFRPATPSAELRGRK